MADRNLSTEKRTVSKSKWNNGIVRNIDQIIAKEEGYVFNQLNLLGDVLGNAKQLGGDTIFLHLGSSEAEDKIELSKVAREIKSYSLLCSQNVKTRQLTLKLS